MSQPRLLVVSYLGRQDPPSPRTERTVNLIAALESSWEISLIAGPAPVAPSSGRRGTFRGTLQAALGHASRAVLLDRFEPWSRHALSRLPEVDAGLLIGFPFSPVAVAARRLAARDVPYVVDAGDPWVLTAASPPNRFLGLRRARAEERIVWQRARGAVVTTPRQALALHRLFPELEILVRANGFSPVPLSSGDRSSAHTRAGLRLAHFGLISGVRLDVSRFFESLLAGGHWQSIELHQYGTDWSAGLAGLPSGVSVVHHQERPWPEIVRLSRNYDAALVVGNRNPAQLPSKAVSYLTLPIPRIALVNGDDDALGDYVRDKRGWLVVSEDDAEVAGKVGDHVSRAWTAADLEAPTSEAWENVAEQIAGFVNSALCKVRDHR